MVDRKRVFWPFAAILPATLITLVALYQPATAAPVKLLCDGSWDRSLEYSDGLPMVELDEQQNAVTFYRPAERFNDLHVPADTDGPYRAIFTSDMITVHPNANRCITINRLTGRVNDYGSSDCTGGATVWMRWVCHPAQKQF